MEASRQVTFRRLVLVLDAVIIVGSMLAAFWLHGALREAVVVLKTPPRFHEYAALAYLMLPVWLLLILALGLDRSFERPVAWTETVIELVKLHVAGLVGLALILFLTQSVVNRSLVGLFLVCTFGFMLSERMLLGWWLRYQHKTGQGRWRVLLAGQPGEAMAAFVRDACIDPLPPHFVGYVTAQEGDASTTAGSLPRLGTIGDLEQILQRDAIDQVLFFPPFELGDQAEGSLRVLDMLGVPASFAVKPIGSIAAVPRPQSLYGYPFVTFHSASKPIEALTVKQALDVIGAIAALVCLVPLLLVGAVAIVVTMGFPVLFVQERAGLFGRPFRMIKFRTMTPGADMQRDDLLARNEMKGPVFKVSDDPRVTPVGRWLRQWSLDELPQLFNVLLGSMSLVGPRPLPSLEQQQIRGWHRRRLSMKPGITGLWQVSGRNDVDFEDWMKLDLRYVDEWSLWLDAWILLKTIPAVILRRGAH